MCAISPASAQRFKVDGETPSRRAALAVDSQGFSSIAESLTDLEGLVNRGDLVERSPRNFFPHCP